MKRDIPERLWICPVCYDSQSPRMKFSAYRDPEVGCPEKTRNECLHHKTNGCQGMVSIPLTDEGLQWWQSYGQKLRNAVAECSEEVLDDDGLLEFPQHLKSLVSDLTKRCVGYESKIQQQERRLNELEVATAVNEASFKRVEQERGELRAVIVAAYNADCETGDDGGVVEGEAAAILASAITEEGCNLAESQRKTEHALDDACKEVAQLLSRIVGLESELKRTKASIDVEVDNRIREYHRNRAETHW